MSNRATSAVSGVWGAVGDTPLLHLVKLSKALGRDIFGKAEHMNPGGSVKDRAALGMIEAAEQSGALPPGGTIVEGTAGNTGIGLTLLGRARGYKVVIVMPDNQAAEKYELLRLLGAELITVPPTAFANEGHFYHTAKRVAAERPGAFWANQFENLANSDVHYRTTGPEIWRQVGGKLDAFVTSSGTGGTIGGVSAYLKEQAPTVRVTLADPGGSGLCSYVQTGVIKSSGESITEGIGIMRITANYARARIDDAMSVHDQQLIKMAYWLIEHESLCVGTSGALNVWAAATVALQLPPGARVVTILCDVGERYRSRQWNREWLASKGLVGEPGLPSAP
ncbi:MAG: cysteine synthase A [Myxococcales bacterium]|nr:cysteine synthase A [Myxococcales bacterium]